MTTENKESIKLKIVALLNKNVANGATEEEAASALAMASKLMEKYYISAADINNPFIGEKAEMHVVPMVKSTYDFNLFLSSLAKLFDCQVWITPSNQTITFFGFKNDTAFCEYFYNLIVVSSKRDARTFRKKGAGTELKAGGIAGKTIVANFIKGYLLKVSQRLQEMYQARQSEATEQYGLILYDKAKLVKQAFEELNMKFNKGKKANFSNLNEQAFRSGVLAGKNLNINVGLNGSNSDLTKKLT